MKKQLKVSFHFLESNKSVLGLEYSQGTLSFSDEEKKQNFDELIIGFLFFYISIMYTTEKGDS